MPRTILITGGSGKIGRILVKNFLDMGDVVIATCFSEDSQASLAASFSKYGRRLTVIRSDLRAENAASALVDAIRAEKLQPDSLVNNARSLLSLKLDDEGLIARGDFIDEFLLDVIAPYELTMALSRQADSKLRWVVNIGSQYGAVAVNPNLYESSQQQAPLHYGVAKAALAHLTKELAVRLADNNIAVNCIAFGGVEGRVDEEFIARYQNLCPSKRMLNDEDLVGPIDTLLSEKFSAMTGQTISVDGGWTLW